MNIKVSIIASAIRVRFWERFLHSLRNNTVEYEVIFVGDINPSFNLSGYPEFTHIYSKCKPAECYQMAMERARGELIHWTADDADYNNDLVITKNPIDNAYKRYKAMEEKFGDEKTVIAMRPFEDGVDIWDTHYFFGGQSNTPRMAPFGLMNREYAMALGGYDRRFINGQSENDLVMRVYQDGGRVELCMEAIVWVNHEEAHRRWGKFRDSHAVDRKILESFWCKPDKSISKTRLLSFEPFPLRARI